MKFDNIIIGGGLAGLTCAIRLQESGRRCAVVSTGQSALHFLSGSLDLLGFRADGGVVEVPADELAALGEQHPYRKLGNRFQYCAEEAEQLLARCGVTCVGSARRNHYRFTPMGTMRPTWLTLSEFATSTGALPQFGERVLLANFAGFLDFNTGFIADALADMGVKCRVHEIEVEAVNRLRQNCTEMRASNIAKCFEQEENVGELIAVLNGFEGEYDTVLLPAVFGFATDAVLKRLHEAVKVSVKLLPTMPPSVAGIRLQMMLRRRFESLGGVYMMGDRVQSVEMEGDRVRRVFSANLGETPLEAENFILTTGHFFSGGLTATPTQVREPLFDCEVHYLPERRDWYADKALDRHNYSTFGVVTDEKFRARRNGRNFENLYAAGAVLGGADALAEGSGAGISMLTALFVAEELI